MTIKELACLMADEFNVSVKVEIENNTINLVDSNIYSAVLNSSKLKKLGINMKYNIYNAIHNYNLIIKS